MSFKLLASLLLPVFVSSFSLPVVVFAAEDNWLGEWGSWSKPKKGAGVKIKAHEAFLHSEDGEGHRCDLKGKFEAASETEAKFEAKALKNARTCTIVLTQNPDASNRALKVAFEGRDCLKFCNSEKAQTIPDELPRLSNEAFFDPLPWPECQTSGSPHVITLCGDAVLSKKFLSIQSDESAVRKLQSAFYVEKNEQLGSLLDPLKECEGKEDAKACLTETIEATAKDVAAHLAKMRKLKRAHEADLSSKLSRAESKKIIESFKGTYSRKFRSGTTGGDKFDVTDDLRLDAEGEDLTFDVLLNFFDEQECTLSGSATALKSGRFLFKDSGRGKKADPKCKLLIMKEGTDLVLADDPPESCRSHCGKGGSFYGARFPLSSRK